MGANDGSRERADARRGGLERVSLLQNRYARLLKLDCFDFLSIYVICCTDLASSITRNSSYSAHGKCELSLFIAQLKLIFLEIG
jgi:hypothetical protein